MEFRPARRDQIEDLVAFCEAYPTSPSWSVPLRRLLSELPASDDCIFDGWENGERRVVVVLIDTVQNLHRVAMFEILGIHPRMDCRFYAFIQPFAEQHARAAGRTGLESYVPSRLGWNMSALGWRVTREAFAMERSNPDISAPPLPTGLRWRDLQNQDALAYYRLLQEAFADDPAMQITEYPLFCQNLERRTLPIRLLCRYEKILGFVRVSLEGPWGCVDTIGRAPAARGQGIGVQLVAEAARLLRELGARHLKLEVNGENQAARRLYKSLGFLDVEHTEVWLRSF